MGQNDEKNYKNTLPGAKTVAEAQSLYLFLSPVDGDDDVAITGRNDEKNDKSTCRERKQ